jgi:hypothetical protein
MVAFPRLVNVTSSETRGQGALVMVHLKTLAPLPRPVTAEFGSEGLAICPLPETRVHKPVPKEAGVACKVPEPPQTLASIPALACWLKTLVITTVSFVAGQEPFEIVQTNKLSPVPSPLTEAFGKEGFETTPAPDNKVQVPDPVPGAFP